MQVPFRFAIGEFARSGLFCGVVCGLMADEQGRYVCLRHVHPRAGQTWFKEESVEPWRADEAALNQTIPIDRQAA